MRRKFMAWIMSIMMIATMMPTMAFAEGESGGESVSPAHTKTIKKNDDGTYTLKLDVKGAVSSTSAKPKVDLVIIADVSGSMNYEMGGWNRDTRLNSLKTSAKSLTSALLDNDNVDAKIALVKYSGQRGNKDYNDASVVTQWTDSNNTINSGIDSLNANGGTNCQAGLYEARTKVLNSARSDAQKIVIFMSDGEPTFYYSDDNWDKGSTKGAGNADGDTADDWGHVTSGKGSCSNAAYTEAEKITDIDAFYSIGISSAAKEKFLKDLIQKPAKGKNITREYYSATDTSALQKAFEDIAAQVTEFNYSKVSITDKLSKYVDIVGDDPVLTVKVTDKDGNPVANNEGLTASYDSASKSVKLIFPEKYTLKDGYTYSVEFVVKPSQEAEKYFDSNDGYPNTGDEGTDWDDNNKISAGKKGLYSNDNDGTELKYTYKEKDYTDKYPKPVIKVSPKTDISGKKTWVDDSNKDKTRPGSITLKLYRTIKGGTKEAVDATPIWSDTDKDTWRYVFKNLPKTDADGNVYTYTVEEELASDSPYEVKYDGNNITNSLKSGNTDFSGEKVWKDSDGKTIDNDKLPASIEIELLQNGKSMTPAKTATVTPGADGKWTYKFDKLPKYDENGKRYQYYIKELSVNGYQSSVTETGEMTNQYNGGESVTVEGTKTWTEVPDGAKVPEVTIKLLQSGNEYKTTTVTKNANGEYVYKFDNLPKYDQAGKEYKYTVEEVTPDGYESKKDGNNFENTYTGGAKKDVKGNKTWANVPEGAEVPEVTINLLQNGTKIDSTKVKPNTDGTYSYEFKDLPTYDPSGKEYKYTVEEVTPDGYTSKQDGNNFENTYTGGKEISISGTKTWLGMPSGLDKKDYPDVTIILSQNGTEYDRTTLTEGKGDYEFKGLPEYNTDGKKFEYTVSEVVPDGYVSEQNGNDFTNTYTPGTVSINGVKNWVNTGDSNKFPEVTVDLYQNGTKIASTVIKDGAISYSFDGLDELDPKGKPYVYTVKENVPNGYTVKQGDGDKKYELTNTYTGGDTEYTVEKKWAGVDKDDPLPAKVKVTLYRDGDKTEETAELTQDNDWKHVFKDLKKYRTDGSEYEYSVREEKIDGYTTEYGDNTVINSYTGGDKVSVKGTKTWIDPEGTTHPTITIELYRSADGIDETFVKSTELANGTTDYEFTDLEKYATNGSEYTYTVKEKTVDGYTTSYDKEKPNNITNTIEQEKIEVKGTKTWIDADGTERPDVSVQLYRDGDKLGDPVKIENNKYEFKDLNKYDLTDGHVYKYTVRELGADGYITTIDGYDITNSRPIKTVKGANDKSEIKVGQELTYTISWTNASDEAVTATIKDTLTKGQEYVSGDEGAVVETKDGITTVKWENVAVAAGSKVEKTFTVKVTKDAEKTVDNTAVIKVGDKPEIDSNTTSVTPKIDISGEKIWKDKDDNFKLRPDSVKITLLANGEKTDKTTEATEASGWKYSFSDLPLYNDGKKIEYTVEETPVDNYLEPEYEVVNKDGNANKINITNSIDEELFSWTGDITVDKAVAVKVDNEYAPQKVTDTFYFALFSDKELTKRATMKSEDGTETEIGIEKLELKNEASGTVTFKDIPTGTIKEPVKYYLAETDKDGVPVGEGFRYTPEFGQSGSEVSLTVKDHDADLKVANVFDNKIDVSGKKTWVDDNDKHKQRPDDITVFLKQNEEDYRDAQENTYAVHASKDTDWAYTFKDLPEFDENGDRYEYSVDEALVAYYDAVFDGMDITNTFDKKKYYGDNPATITVTKETLLKGKEYKVNDIYYAGVFVDKDHTTLLADEEGAYIIPLVLENESSAPFEFKVPYHEDGTATYYITEVTKDGTPVDKVSGLKYKASVKGGKVTVSAEDSMASVTFTNSYEQPKVPETGDSGLPWIWLLAGLMAAALAAAAWIIFGRRETRRL